MIEQKGIEVLFDELVPRQDAIVRRQWEGGTASLNPIAWLRAHDVYMDTAWLDGGLLRTAVDRLGADRLLYGTDGSAHPGSMPYFGAQLEQLGLSPDELRQIQHGNAERVFAAR